MSLTDILVYIVMFICFCVFVRSPVHTSLGLTVILAWQFTIYSLYIWPVIILCRCLCRRCKYVHTYIIIKCTYIYIYILKLNIKTACVLYTWVGLKPKYTDYARCHCMGYNIYNNGFTYTYIHSTCCMYEYHINSFAIL